MRSVTVGLVIFAVGVLTALLMLSGLVFDNVPQEPILWFVAMLSGVGFAILLFGLWAAARRRRRTIRQTAPRSSTRT